MADTSIERRAPAIPVVSPGELAPYAIFAGIVLLVLVYFVGVEQGALSVVGGMKVHEFVHDARHLLAFPCH
jgi:Probable cobalt transporter subunit (CbtB)